MGTTIFWTSISATCVKKSNLMTRQPSSTPCAVSDSSSGNTELKSLFRSASLWARADRVQGCATLGQTGAKQDRRWHASRQKIQISWINGLPTCPRWCAQLEMQVRPCAEACAADTANHLSLAHRLTGSHINLREMAIERAAQWLGMFQFDGDAIPTGKTTA